MIQRKVCHLTTVHPIDDIRIFNRECTSLASHGYSVTLIACGEKSFEDFKNGVVRISLNVPVKNRLHRMIKRTIAIYKRALVINADIYHFHDPELLTVGLMLKRKGKIVIFDSHEFYGDQIREKHYLPKVFRNTIAIAYLKYEEYVCKRINAVVQVCKLEGKDYFANRASKSVFISNVPIIKKPISDIDYSVKIRNSIAYIGGITYERGITHLIKAAHKAQFKLILCGDFYPKEYQKVLQSFSEYSIVDYRGFVSYNQISEILSECFVGMSTLLHIGQYSKINTLPTKVFEYMQLGLPVIITDTPFAKEMIEKYKFGLCVDPTNIVQISNAIRYIYNNPCVAKEMGNNGKKVILDLCNWHNEEKKLLELYKSL